MKIIHLSHSDISGGASRAAYRVHAMLSKHNIDSSMWVDIKNLMTQKYLVQSLILINL